MKTAATGHTSPSERATANQKPAPQPASGPAAAGGGFSLRLPRGWVDATDRTEQPNLVTGVDVRADDAPPMVTVVRDAHRVAGVRGATAASRHRLQAVRVRRIAVLPPVKVAGVSAAHLTGVDPDPAVHSRIDQVSIPTAHGTFVVTFRTSRWQVAPDRDRMIASVLATCHWRH